MAKPMIFFGLLIAAACIAYESSGAVAPFEAKPTSDNGTDRSTTAAHDSRPSLSSSSSDTSLPTITSGSLNVDTQPNDGTLENEAVEVTTNSTRPSKSRRVKRDDFHDSMKKRLEEMEGAEVVSVRKCCFNDNYCRDLKDGEECSEALFPDVPKTGHRKISSFSSTTRRKTTKSGGDPDESTKRATNKSFNLNDNLIKEIREKVLEKSNFYRKKHGVKPLEMDTKMNNYAQTWANHLEGKGLIHRTNRIYGENLYGTTDSNNIGEKAVSAWYNEISLFKPNDNEDQLFRRSSIHHMTQLLWKSSRKMGVGVSKGKNGWYTVVANYDPPGNFKDSFKQNLPKISRK